MLLSVLRLFIPCLLQVTHIVFGDFVSGLYLWCGCFTVIVLCCLYFFPMVISCYYGISWSYSLTISKIHLCSRNNATDFNPFLASHDFCGQISHLLLLLGSPYCKQYELRSSCSKQKDVTSRRNFQKKYWLDKGHLYAG